MTATFISGGRFRRTRHARTRTIQRRDPDDDAAADVEGVMHAAVHARGRDERNHPDREQPGDDANRRFRNCEVIKSASPPYTAIAAAVCPDG